MSTQSVMAGWSRCKRLPTGRKPCAGAERDRRALGCREGNEERGRMSKVRVLVGTRKGAFILTSDGKREKWDVSGPHFAGWEMYPLKGSPADPNRIYASQTSGWFGQIIQRSDDGGKTWHQPGTPPGEHPAAGPPQAASNKFVYDAATAPLTTHQWYDGTQHPWEFKRVWHMEPSLTDPNMG